MTTPANFYVTGGSLHLDTPSYVERRADQELYDALLKMEFCYILTSRQMGKSSLMVHTVGRLRKQNVKCVVLDLTAIGQNLAPDQWYYGLLSSIGEQTGLEDELDDFWVSHNQLGCVQRWVMAIRSVVLERTSAPIVIFIDEIDAVRSLPFTTDEFFSAIRECYNRRTEDAAFNRLAFSLFGVAAPSDLIRDVRTTPFNIGKRIELADFRAEEAVPLAQELGADKGGNNRRRRSLLARILRWTGGHPYLTQSLCRAAAELAYTQQGTIGRLDIDRLCKDLFFSERAKETDNNLVFVRERLFRSEQDLASVLDTYSRVLKGRRVPDDQTNPIVMVLRLAGITRSAGGALKVRNRIYQTVFNYRWVQANTPYAELWRQKRAYRRGLLRALALSGIIVASMGALTIKSVSDSRHIRTLLARSDEDRGEQLLESDVNYGLLYLLEGRKIAADPTEPSDWASWMQACVAPLAHTLPLWSTRPMSTAFTGDGMAMSETGNRLVTWGHTPDKNGQTSTQSPTLLKVWDRITGRRVGRDMSTPGDVVVAAFSPHGGMLATVESILAPQNSGVFSGTGSVTRLWNPVTGQQVGNALSFHDRPSSLQFSSDGSRLMLSGFGGMMRILDVSSGRILPAIPHMSDSILIAALSPDGRTVAFQDNMAKMYLGDLATGRLTVLVSGAEVFHMLVFSADGKTLSGVWREWADNFRHHPSGEITLLARQWQVATGKPAGPQQTQQADLFNVSPHGDWLVTIRKGVVTRWDLSTRGHVVSPKLLDDDYYNRAISPDGSCVVADSSSASGIEMWDLTTGIPFGLPILHRSTIGPVKFSPDGSQLLFSSGAELTIWDVSARRPQAFPVKVVGQVTSEMRGNMLGIAGQAITNMHTISLWDANAGERVFSGSIKPDQNRKPDSIANFHAGFYQPQQIALSPDGAKMAAVTGEDTLRIVSAQAAKQSETPVRSSAISGHTATGEIKLPGFIQAMAFSNDGKLLAAGTSNGNVQILNADTGAPAVSVLKFDNPVIGLAFDSQGGKLAAIGSDEGAIVWDLKANNAALRINSGHTDVSPHPAFVQFQPYIGTLAVLCTDPLNGWRVRLWNSATGQEVRANLKQQGTIYVWEQQIIGFSPNGRSFAIDQGALGKDYRDTVEVWDTATWKSSSVKLPENLRFLKAAWSPDNRWLAIAAEDTSRDMSGAGPGEWMAMLVDLKTCTANQQVIRRPGSFLGISFPADDLLLAAGADRDMVRLWRLPAKQCDYSEMERQTWFSTGARLDAEGKVELFQPGELANLEK